MTSFLTNKFLLNIKEARKLINKEVLFETEVRSSAKGERRQLVLGKVLDVVNGSNGGFNLKVHNYRRTAQATTDPFVATDWDGRAIRTYSANSTRIIDVLTDRGIKG
jgi:hypothetical protein